MTPPATGHCNATSLSPFPPRRAPCPTSPPPSGWPAPLSPKGRPTGPSAKRLTASRHPLPEPLDPPNAEGVDTGRLLSPTRGIQVPNPDPPATLFSLPAENRSSTPTRCSPGGD